jgi:hypothetical protein
MNKFTSTQIMDIDDATRAAAVALGRRGGLARTKAKAEAAKRNGGQPVRAGQRPRGRPWHGELPA